MLNVYLWGWLVTTIGAFFAAYRFSGRRMSPPPARGLPAVLAGALWPVLTVGVCELVVMAVMARTARGSQAYADEQRIDLL